MKQQFRSLFLALTLGAGLTLSLTAAPQWHDDWDRHNYDHADLRGLIQHIQSDLSLGSNLAHGHDQVERFQHAEDALSGFDRGLSKHHFDKPHLDNAIEKVQSVLDHNTLEPGARDALRRDVEILRDVRTHHDHDHDGY